MHLLACYKEVPGRDVSPAKAYQKVTLLFTSTLTSDIAKFTWKFMYTSKAFTSVFNQLDAQNLFHNKFYFMPLHVSSTFAHHQEVKIVYTASGIIAPIGAIIPEAVYTILTS